MKFLYKIYSGYDGFTPREIPNRLDREGCLRLGWLKYIDDVSKHDKVVVFFKNGPQKFQNGVYLEGTVQRIDINEHAVYIRVTNYDLETPLTAANESQRIAEVVAPRRRQVFLYPPEWIADECNYSTSADSCEDRQCDQCPTWQQFSRIDPDDCGEPRRLSRDICEVIPAYWVRPSICYIRVSAAVRQTSNLFYRFKTGDKALAYPLARGIYESLRDRGQIEFDCIVPIPLSPDKEEAGEINRTKLLADELAMLLDVPVKNILSLRHPISKRRMLATGVYTNADFRRRYYATLNVNKRLPPFSRVLLLDDVCTEGSTLSQVVRRIREQNRHCRLTAVTAGQMILKHVVQNEAAVSA